MTPHPKRKLSQGRRDRRRSHLALRATPLVDCPQCHEPRRPHHVCLNCGMYDGVQVLEMEAPKTNP